MSDHNNHNQPESSGIKAKPILAFLFGLGLMILVTFFIIEGLLMVFRKMDDAEPRQPVTAVKPADGKLILPPEPLLQGAPGPGSTEKLRVPTMLPLEEMAEDRKKENKLASSYGWINKENGIARIPLEDAKKIIVSKGLPVGPEALRQELLKAEQTRKQVLNAVSSAGRNIQ